MLGLFFTNRNRAAKQAELQWITANGSAGEFYFCTLNKTQNHEPLHHGIRRIDRPNDPFLPAL